MSIAFIILVLKESVILPLFSVFWGQYMQFLHFCILRCSILLWYKGNLHNVIEIKVPQYWLKTSLYASFMGRSLLQDSAIALLIIYLLYVRGWYCRRCRSSDPEQSPHCFLSGLCYWLVIVPEINESYSLWLSIYSLHCSLSHW